jgi:hypothetical protein
MRHGLVADHGAGAADTALASAAASLLEKHDPSRSVEALTSALVALLEEANALSNELLLACAQEGEVGFLGQVLGRRAGIHGTVALDELLSGKAERVMALLRVAGFSRELSAGLLAGIGDLLGIADPGIAIGIFDRMGADEVNAAASWLAAARAYRAAVEALGSANG